MKKPLAVVISAFMTLALVLSLTACAPSKTENTGSTDTKRKLVLYKLLNIHPSTLSEIH